MPQYECELCQDTGYREVIVRNDNAPWESQLIVCLCVAARFKKLPPAEICERLMLSGMHSFETLRNANGIESALNVVKGLVENNGAYKLVLVYGVSGNGKTHMAEAAALGLLDKGVICPVLAWPQVVAGLRQSMGGASGMGFDDLIAAYCGRSHLILDDVGAGMSGSDFGMKEFDEIINWRYRKEKWTLVTTNLKLSQLPDRTVSRFADAHIARCVLNKAVDYRPRRTL